MRKKWWCIQNIQFVGAYKGLRIGKYGRPTIFWTKMIVLIERHLYRIELMLKLS